MEQQYLMDSNTVIDFFNGSLPPVGRQFLSGIAPAISVITQIELFASNHITTQEFLILKKFVSVATIYNTLDEKIVMQTIDIRRNFKIKTPDAIIAATAISFNLTLITNNISDFKKIIELRCVNPYQLK